MAVLSYEIDWNRAREARDQKGKDFVGANAMLLLAWPETGGKIEDILRYNQGLIRSSLLKEA